MRAGKKPLKVMLANPPWVDENRPWLWGVRAGSRWPHMEHWTPDREPPPYLPFPHFLAQATALLERCEGIEVLLRDSVAMGERPGVFYGSVASFEPDVFFMETSSPSLLWDLNVIRRLRECHPDLKIGVGGAHKELMNKEWLASHHDLDFVCFGEYEQSLEELIKAIRDGVEGPIDGAHICGADGSIIEGKYRPPCAELDDYPRYAYHFLPMHRYTDCPVGKGPSVQVWTSRGCPFGCSFCVWPQVIYNERRFRTRSVKNVVDEVEWLIKNYDFKSFYFDDDTTNVSKKRTIELAAEIKKRRLGAPWSMMARADCMDRETLEACYDSGMRTIKYGVESGSQELLDHSAKKLQLDKVREVCRVTRELGIHMHLTFMIGLPGETRESAMETIELALELDPDTLQFSLCTPFPGTSLYEEAEANGWLRGTTSYDGFNDSSLNLPTISAQELEELHREAKERWNVHCASRMKDGALRAVLEAIHSIPRGARLAVYGVGQFTRRAFPEIRKHSEDGGVQLVGFIDDAAEEGARYEGYPVATLEDALEWSPEYVILSSDAYADVMAQKAEAALPDCRQINPCPGTVKE